MRGLVHLHVNCHIQGKVMVDIPFKITRDKKTKENYNQENEKGLSGRLQ